jgi:hypothetical protein
MRLATLDAAIRRGCVWPISPPPLARPRPELQHDLGQLRRLAGARLAADDHHLVLAMARAMSSRRLETGSDSGKVMGAPGWPAPARARGGRSGRSARGGRGAAGGRGAVRGDE